MHSSATRLRLISRLIVVALVVIVALIVVIHDHVAGTGGHAATPTRTPALSAPARRAAPEGASWLIVVASASGPHSGT
jgi:hypothetical protein